MRLKRTIQSLGKTMSRASLLLIRVDTGEHTMLCPGDLIGRSEAAALHIDDPRISEAHAMVSLRECQLKLIGLRGRFLHRGELVREVVMRRGVRVELAPRIELVCEDLTLPDTMVGLELPGNSVLTLIRTVSLSFEGGVPQIKTGFEPNAEAVFWSVGSRWRVRVAGGETRPLAPGDVLTIGAHSVRIVGVSLEQTSLPRTRSRLRSPLTFQATPACVIVSVADAPDLRIAGVPGRILSSVLTRGGSATWEEIISDVWPADASSKSSLRARFDTGLKRLRASLRDALPGPDELLHMDGTGVLVARLGRDDRVMRSP